MKLCEKNARTRASESFERSRMLERGFLDSVSNIRGENTQAREELSQYFRRQIEWEAPVVKEKLSFCLRVVSFQKVLIHTKKRPSSVRASGENLQIFRSRGSLKNPFYSQLSGNRTATGVGAEGQKKSLVRPGRLVSKLRFCSYQQAITKPERSNQGGCKQTLGIKEMR